ncbi:hypothetical protein CBZ_20200 [Cellulomonas biazotea]|uniref:Uncharacterized protein n=1 Tax=Cellulomonas biazotea TaxID=1709 RepID=A0A402DS71_9CELL|nr:hypothetical protein CBZ_20200 [Cellulomonas biazotea]
MTTTGRPVPDQGVPAFRLPRTGPGAACDRLRHNPFPVTCGAEPDYGDKGDSEHRTHRDS